PPTFQTMQQRGDGLLVRLAPHDDELKLHLIHQPPAQRREPLRRPVLLLAPAAGMNCRDSFSPQLRQNLCCNFPVALIQPHRPHPVAAPVMWRCPSPSRPGSAPRSRNAEMAGNVMMKSPIAPPRMTRIRG